MPIIGAVGAIGRVKRALDRAAVGVGDADRPARACSGWVVTGSSGRSTSKRRLAVVVGRRVDLERLARRLDRVVLGRPKV